MSAAILAILNVILQISSGASGQMIVSIISMLEQAIPLLVKEYQSVAPMIKNIIAVLRNNNAVTDDQQAQLNVLDAQTDAAFEAAAKVAQAQDGAV